LKAGFMKHFQKSGLLSLVFHNLIVNVVGAPRHNFRHRKLLTVIHIAAYGFMGHCCVSSAEHSGPRELVFIPYIDDYGCKHILAEGFADKESFAYADINGVRHVLPPPIVSSPGNGGTGSGPGEIVFIPCLDSWGLKHIVAAGFADKESFAYVDINGVSSPLKNGVFLN
jgi:hypothetical protein